MERRKLSDLPLGRQLMFYAAMALIAGVAIAWLAFLQVTLRKVFELSDPWDVVKAFLAVTVVTAICQAVALGLPWRR